MSWVEAVDSLKLFGAGLAHLECIGIHSGLRSATSQYDHQKIESNSPQSTRRNFGKYLFAESLSDGSQRRL